MNQTELPRSAGLLLHPTSLPGPYGVGDLGPEAYRWVRFLAAAKQSWWQVLPLGPTGAGDSPYQSDSAFAGNVTLLSPELLVRDGLIEPGFLDGVSFPADRAAYEHAIPFKSALVREAWGRFQAGCGPANLRNEYDAFARREASWLDDYALFASIHESLGNAGLADWPAHLRRREPAALAAIERDVADRVARHRFGQFLFDRQWNQLRKFARDHGIRIIGDTPIFVSPDSADVWANPDLFLLDADRAPTVVAGVPPDYFSATGQLWGNPLYDWQRMAQDGYAWWSARMKRDLEQVDLIRLDHFRGFAAAWHIPAGEATAERGRWVNGPRGRLFEALRSSLGRLPFIAEDLGLITDDVHQLRLDFGLPGMRVLQFALGNPDNPYWPHNYEPNTVVYTGTHDNDTTAGWYAKLSEHDRTLLGRSLGRRIEEPAWDLLAEAWSSVGNLAIAPLQDVLQLGSESRMNVPGAANGNWLWRVRPDQFTPGLETRLAELTTLYNRVPKAKQPSGRD